MNVHAMVWYVVNVFYVSCIGMCCIYRVVHAMYVVCGMDEGHVICVSFVQWM